MSDRVVMMTNGPAATIGAGARRCRWPRPRDRIALAEDPAYNHCRGRRSSTSPVYGRSSARWSRSASAAAQLATARRAARAQPRKARLDGWPCAPERQHPLESELKKSRLVMVGNGMAGVRTIEELLKVAPDLYDVTVFGAEPHPNYNRILLSPVLAGEQTLDEIVLNSWEWYEENDIRLHAGKKVVRDRPRAPGGARRGRYRGGIRPPAAVHRLQPVHPARAGQGPARA